MKPAVLLTFLFLSCSACLMADNAALAAQDDTVVFGGRLGEYQYYDMDKVIASALACAQRELA